MKAESNNKLKIYLVILFFTISSLSIPTISAKNGEDVVPDLGLYPLENLTFTTPSLDNSKWTLNVNTLDNNRNITNITLETQICVYDPIVCHAPKFLEMTRENNSWSGEITTLEKHSYVNWRLNIVYEDGNESLIPERSNGYAKVWSKCWEIMEDQKVINNFESCGMNINNNEEIAGFSLIIGVTSLLSAVIVSRKR